MNGEVGNDYTNFIHEYYELHELHEFFGTRMTGIIEHGFILDKEYAEYVTLMKLINITFSLSVL